MPAVVTDAHPPDQSFLTVAVGGVRVLVEAAGDRALGQTVGAQPQYIADLPHG
jgi:hypothetical protein